MEHGVRYREECIGRCRIERIELLEEDCARKMGKPRGNYVTLHCRPFWKLGEEELEEAIRLLAGEIRAMCLPAEGITERFGVLVVGLGNAEITADAVGPKTVHRLTVTRHLHEHDREIFRLLGRCQLSAIAPGVLGQTGMEAAALVADAARTAEAKAVIAVDALAARATERLAATVQIADTGIRPGSGIGNSRAAITAESCGVPVIALGVPTVVDSSTLVWDALSRAGIGAPSEELRRVLEDGRSYIVSPRESDQIASSVSALLAQAINRLLTPALL
jgi:spore protease